MKKFAQRFVLLVMSLSIFLPLTSLTTVSAQEDRVEISFINGFTGGDGSYMSTIVEGFNESQDQYFVKEVQEVEHYVQFTTGDFDLVVMHGTHLATYKADGMIQDISSILEQAGLSLDAFHPAAESIVQFSDGIYAVPLDIHPLTTFYNLEYVEESPADYQALMDINSQVKEENENLYALGIPDTGLVEFYIFLIAAQNGVNLQGEGYINFAQEEIADALMTYHQMIYEDNLSPAGLGLDGEFQAFMADVSGDTAQTVVSLTGPWYYQAMVEAYGDQLGIGTIPIIGEELANYGNSHTISVSTNVTEEDKLAGIAAFFEYMYQPDVLINWAASGQAPLHLETMDLVAENQEEYPLSYQNQSMFDNFVAAPKVYQYGEQMRYMNETVFGRIVIDQNLTKEDLMTELEAATQIAQEIGSMGSVE